MIRRRIFTRERRYNSRHFLRVAAVLVVNVALLALFALIGAMLGLGF